MSHVTNHVTGTGKYEQLLERCRSLPPIATAVAHPCEASALAGAMEAAQLGLITPILVGPAAKIAEVARAQGIDLGKARVVDVPHSHASAARAVELVRQGEAELLMKGSLHTDELLGAVVARETGLRTGRRISHVFIMDVPTYHKVLIVTDAAINIAPSARGQGGHLPERDRPGRLPRRGETEGGDSRAPSKRSPPRCPPRSMRRRSARWRSAARSRAVCWTGRWRSTTRSARTRRG